MPQPDNVAHLLVCLMEEASEVQKAAAKALRFGLKDAFRGPAATPEAELSAEINDFVVIVDALRRAGVEIHYSDAAQKEKCKKLSAMMLYSRDVQGPVAPGGPL